MPQSLANAAIRLLRAAAGASDSAEPVVAVAGELRELLHARAVSVDLTMNGSEPRRWRVEGPAATEAAPDAAPDAASSAADVSLRVGEVAVGVLSVFRAATLTAHELSLASLAADVLVVSVAREGRLRALEHELALRVHEVAEQRAFIERVVDSLPFGLYVVDREYRIHAWNHKRETGLQGVSRTDALGRTIFEVLHRQPAAMLKQEFDEVFATGKLQQFQMESRAFGDPRTFRISKIPMRVHGESVSHVITVGEDITEWKAALDRTAQSEKLAALGQLAAGVMHEINNPLATIAACGEALSLHRELAATLPPGATVPGSKPEQMLHIIDLEVQRCKKIVNGLLDFARPKPDHRAVVDVNDVIVQGTFLLQHHPRYKRVHLDVTCDPTPMLVVGDADQLVQVLIALAMNALDVTPEGGHIVLRTRRAAQDDGATHVVLEVSDDGPGVPRALQSKVFEPFFTTKPQGEGTGLGLAICYGIISDHGGQMELISAEGQGATFQVILPEAVGLTTGVSV
ncbi:MAG: PAS domain-containing protein [Gemmatimonadaceae bacterium]|nr:PAS domain-containing protein [Gemmatimonadaceae bacterium]